MINYLHADHLSAFSQHRRCTYCKERELNRRGGCRQCNQWKCIQQIRETTSFVPQWPHPVTFTRNCNLYWPYVSKGRVRGSSRGVILELCGNAFGAIPDGFLHWLTNDVRWRPWLGNRLHEDDQPLDWLIVILTGAQQVEERGQENHLHAHIHTNTHTRQRKREAGQQ